MKNLFNTEEKQNDAVALFRALIQHEGWQLHVKILQQNIDVLKEQIINSQEDETIESINRKRDKIKAYTEAINSPQNLINKLEAGIQSEKNYDPYQNLEELEKERKS